MSTVRYLSGERMTVELQVLAFSLRLRHVNDRATSLGHDLVRPTGQQADGSTGIRSHHTCRAIALVVTLIVRSSGHPNGCKAWSMRLATIPEHQSRSTTDTMPMCPGNEAKPSPLHKQSTPHPNPIRPENSVSCAADIRSKDQISDQTRACCH